MKDQTRQYRSPETGAKTNPDYPGGRIDRICMNIALIDVAGVA